MQNLFSQMGGGMDSLGVDAPIADTSETVHISSLALLKMLKHGLVALYVFCKGVRSCGCSYGSYGTYVGRICG